MEQDENVQPAVLNRENLEKSFAFMLGLLRDVGANTSDVDTRISESRNSLRHNYESQMESYLRSEPALTALNIGFPRDRVKRATMTKMKQTGFGFSNSNDLIDAILNGLQEETASLNVIYKLY